MTEFCEICLCEGVDGMQGSCFNKEDWTWICSVCIKETLELMNFVKDVPMMMKPDEFVNIFRSKYDQKLNLLTEQSRSNQE